MANTPITSDCTNNVAIIDLASLSRHVHQAAQEEAVFRVSIGNDGTGHVFVGSGL